MTILEVTCREPAEGKAISIQKFCFLSVQFSR